MEFETEWLADMAGTVDVQKGSILVVINDN